MIISRIIVLAVINDVAPYPLPTTLPTNSPAKISNSSINELPIRADYLLVDAVKLDNPLPQEVIIKGDLRSNSIAAASIIAKVTRDIIMQEYDKKFPGYGFSSNAGYGTKKHLEGLETYGATPIHRRSFSPVPKYLN